MYRQRDVRDQVWEAGPIHALAELHIGEHLDRSALLKTQRPTRNILIAGRDTRIAKNCPQDGVSETAVLWTVTTALIRLLKHRPRDTSLYFLLSIE